MAKNAPGKHFREGMSLIEVMRMFPDDKTAEDWFVEQRWPNGVHCPHCGSDNVQSGAKHKTMPFRCREKECTKRFSVRVGTVMESSKLGYQVWLIAMYLLMTSLKSVSSMKLHRDLRITQKAAWHLAHRLRETMNNSSDLFSGPVEVDETYIGGLDRNRHEHKKAKKGRGAVGKTAVIGVKDRATNKVNAKVIEKTDKPTLQGFVSDNIEQGASVYTDDFPAYRGMVDFDHKAVKHSVGEYVKGQIHTNGVESFWSTLKRAHKGTFHQMSPKHLGRYVNEFAEKHNVRELDTIEQMRNIAHGMEGKKLEYAKLIS